MSVVYAFSLNRNHELVQQVIGEAALRLTDDDLLAPRMVGIDEHRYRSVRFFQDPATKA